MKELFEEYGGIILAIVIVAFIINVIFATFPQIKMIILPVLEDLLR